MIAAAITPAQLRALNEGRTAGLMSDAERGILRPRPAIRAILEEVSVASGVPVNAITAGRRDRDTVLARRMACWLMHDRLGWSSVRIGRALDIDHSSALHAVRRMREELAARENAKEATAGVTPPDGYVEDWAGAAADRWVRT